MSTPIKVKVVLVVIVVFVFAHKKFGPKILDPKKYLSSEDSRPKLLDPKNVGYKIIWGTKKCGPKI